jgi:hypothetical protein
VSQFDLRALLSHQLGRCACGWSLLACLSSPQLYEPLYPLPTTYAEMQLDARRWSEEFFYGFTRAAYPPAEAYTLGTWRAVGWLHHPEEGFNRGRTVTHTWRDEAATQEEPNTTTTTTKA